MVLIGRQEEFAAYREDRALDALILALFEPGTPIFPPQRVSQTEDAIVGVMAALRDDNTGLFQQAFSLLERRNMSAQSDWIHDDLLVFSVVVGNIRFGGRDQLIEKLLNLRLSEGDGRSQGISLSLKALAEGKSDAAMLPVFIAGKALSDPNYEFDGHLLSRGFRQATELEIQDDATPFLRILGEKAADVATLIGVRSNASSYFALSSFRERFDRRAKLFGNLMFLLLLFGSAALWVFVVGLFFSKDTESEELAGKLFNMGVVIGPIAVFSFRKGIYYSFRNLFYRAFGGGILVAREKAQNQQAN